MASSSPDVLGPPPELLTLEGLNYMVAALLVVGAQRLGPEYSREVLSMADKLRTERQIQVTFRDSPDG